MMSRPAITCQRSRVQLFAFAFIAAFCAVVAAKPSQASETYDIVTPPACTNNKG